MIEIDPMASIESIMEFRTYDSFNVPQLLASEKNSLLPYNNHAIINPSMNVNLNISKALYKLKHNSMKAILSS